MAQAWQVRWTDDSLHHGLSASDIIVSVAASMWNSQEGASPKETISYRVWTLLRINLDAALPDEQFLIELERHGLIQIITKPT